MREPDHMIEGCTIEQQPPAAEPPTPAGHKRKYLLTSGICKCGNCGEDLQGKPTSAKVAAYACVKPSDYHPHLKGCGRISTLAAPVDELVAGKVLAVMALPSSVDLVKALRERSVRTGTALADQIGAIQDRLRQFGRDRMNGQMSTEAFRAADAEGLAQIRELRQQVRRNRVALGSIDDLDTPEKLAAWWENTATIKEKHDLVRVLVEEVRIKPTERKGYRGFQEERIDIVWQPGIIWKRDKPGVSIRALDR